MRNIFLMLALLSLPYAVLAPIGISRGLRGRIGIACLFAFTGIGHFLKTAAMAEMLPPWVPGRIPIIYATGALELFAAGTVLHERFARATGCVLIALLAAVLPANVYSAIERVDFGGHGVGPSYLLMRIPLQLFLIGWIYWFAIRETNKQTATDLAR